MMIKNDDDDLERNGDNEDFLQEISGVRSRTLCRAPSPRVKRILDDDQHIRKMISILYYDYQKTADGHGRPTSQGQADVG